MPRARESSRGGSRVMRLAAIPVALALGWCAWNQMVEGGGSALQFGRLGEARNTTAGRTCCSRSDPRIVAAVGRGARVVSGASCSFRLQAERSGAVAGRDFARTPLLRAPERRRLLGRLPRGTDVPGRRARPDRARAGGRRRVAARGDGDGRRRVARGRADHRQSTSTTRRTSRTSPTARSVRGRSGSRRTNTRASSGCAR